MPISKPQELVERGLEASRSDECIIIVDKSTTANLRWANNTLTTNGVMHGSSVTVISIVNGARGVSTGVLSRSASGPNEIGALVAAADQAARDAGPAEDAAPLPTGQVSPDWSEPPGSTGIDTFDAFAPALGEVLARSQAEDRLLYGFVDHEVTTTYLGSSTGLRLRHVQPGGHVGITGKDRARTSSAWVGRSTRDFTDVDAFALDADLQQRLSWSARKVDLAPGRYDTILPPTTVADLFIWTYWMSGARDAHEGQTAFSKPGGGTRIGERLTPRRVSLYSDPQAPGLECAPFVTARSSSSESSVFDNGLPLERTAWIDDGVLAALVQTRHSATLTGHALTPGIGNLLMEVDGATQSPDELVLGVENGLLLTCLWYIREVDAQTQLVTGLTRDGVYVVEGGEVVGAANNFRFNESPIDLLGRFSEASRSVPSFSREWGDDFLRTSTPALRVPDFNMSSVSQAS